MKVRYTPDASERLVQVITELAAVNSFAAAHFAHNIERNLRRLAVFPASGFRVREFPDLALRYFIIQPYRFFYRIDRGRDSVWIVDIWHGAQLPSAPDLPQHIAE